ncbi:MAG: ATP-binding protein [Candidatus Melainabacteria bacterium]|nr:ATP-binding protein [Candidatus Melainabacteria bacterium]
MEFSREKYKKLKAELEHPHITILLGARQVGKSYLMSKLRKQVTGEVFFDLEDPATLKSFHGDEEHIFNLLSQSGKYIFIDEFHYLENISKVFKAIYDQGKRNPKQAVKIFASGSSSTEIHKHLKESLAGRKREIIIRPMIFSEYKSQIDSLDEYLVYGGMPGVYHFESRHDRSDYLNEIIKTYIQKDIKSLIKEQRLSAFNKLLYVLAENQGQAISLNSLSKDLSIKYHELQDFVDLLEQTFVLYPLAPYSGNLSNELKKTHKYYLYDHGIRNSLVKDFSAVARRKDQGHIWESYVYHYLLSIQEANNEIRYWRTSSGNEVDFIWLEDRVPTPLEVKTKIEEDEIPSGLKSFLEGYPKSKCAVVVFNKSRTIKDGYAQSDYKGHRIHYIQVEQIDRLEDILQED